MPTSTIHISSVSRDHQMVEQIFSVVSRKTGLRSSYRIIPALRRRIFILYQKIFFHRRAGPSSARRTGQRRKSALFRRWRLPRKGSMRCRGWISGRRRKRSSRRRRSSLSRTVPASPARGRCRRDSRSFSRQIYYFASVPIAAEACLVPLLRGGALSRRRRGEPTPRRVRRSLVMSAGRMNIAIFRAARRRI